MNAAALLTEARNAGIVLTVQGDRLHVEAKPGSVTADLRARLAAGKLALVAVLSARDRLLTLGEAEGLPADLVTDMDAEDLAAWADFAAAPDGTDAMLKKCLRTLTKDVRTRKRQGMECGTCPTDT